MREGWSAWSLGSSLVERAHNLLNGVPLLGGVEAEETSQRGSMFLKRGTSTKEIGIPWLQG